MADTSGVGFSAPGRIGTTRLVVGLLQGLGLLGLHRAFELKAWPARDGPLFAALLLAGAFAPPGLLAGLGHLRRWTLIAWTMAAALFAGLLAAHDVAGALPGTIQFIPNFPVIAFTAVGLFIAHHLIVPADTARRLVAPYPDYFAAAWLDGVQPGLALAFIRPSPWRGKGPI